MNADNKETKATVFTRGPWPYALTASISCAIAVLFFFMMSHGPHSGLGGLGILFFLPAIFLVDLFTPQDQSRSLAAMFFLQTLILVPPVFWVLTWKRRPKAKTGWLVLSVLVAILLFTGFSLKLENERAQRQAEISKASYPTVVATLRTLNAALAEYRKAYGDYPERLDQLGPAPVGTSSNSDRANLVTFPLQGELYFVLSYEVVPVESGERGYEIHADPKSPDYSFLYHYFTNQTGLIRLNNKRATATSLVIGEDTHPTVTIE